MDLSLASPHLTLGYSSASQQARVMSEAWFGTHVYCPACGYADIERYPNNAPVADFFCPVCREDYELKCQKVPFGRKVLDGAYNTMIERLQGNRNPSLFLLRYDLASLTVRNLLVVPKHYFVPAIIEKRPPLKASARRAGWTGCKIILDDVPASGRIALIQDGRVRSQSHVVGEWRAGLFLRNTASMSGRSWLLNVMKCIERLGRSRFSLNDLYSFEEDLRRTYPGNQHIRAKIRQQLQVLRDGRYLTFLGNAEYKLNR